MPFSLAVPAIACDPCGHGCVTWDDLSALDVFFGLLALPIVVAAAISGRIGLHRLFDLGMERLVCIA
jgi:hypothetical protein